MGEFRRRRKVILIATDVAARGLDIQDIQFVVNIDVSKYSSSLDIENDHDGQFSFQIKPKIMFIELVEQLEINKHLEHHIHSSHPRMLNKHQVLFEFYKKLDKMSIQN